jgi:endonuclease YncB( thermonuclease family)
VFQKQVESRCHKRDRYGREVWAMFVGLRDVGLEQIRTGMAWWYREYAHEPSYARAPLVSGRGRRSEGGEARAMEGSQGDAAVGVAKDATASNRDYSA